MIAVYFVLMGDRYPSTDEEQAVHLDFPYPDAEHDLLRGLPLVKWLLAIPHYIVLFFLTISALFAAIFAWFAILFTGRYPRSLFDFIEGVIRWHNRVAAYAFLLITDRYPPFSLQAERPQAPRWSKAGAVAWMLQRSPPPQGSGRLRNGAGILRGIGDGLNPFTMSQMPIDSSQRNSGTVARPDQLDVCVLPRTADIGTTESARLPDQDGDSSAQARASDTRATRSVRPG